MAEQQKQRQHARKGSGTPASSYGRASPAARRRPLATPHKAATRQHQPQPASTSCASSPNACPAAATCTLCPCRRCARLATARHGHAPLHNGALRLAEAALLEAARAVVGEARILGLHRDVVLQGDVVHLRWRREAPGGVGAGQGRPAVRAAAVRAAPSNWLGPPSIPLARAQAGRPLQGRQRHCLRAQAAPPRASGGAPLQAAALAPAPVVQRAAPQGRPGASGAMPEQHASLLPRSRRRGGTPRVPPHPRNSTAQRA